MTEQIGGTGPGHRSVTLTRIEKGMYEVRNSRGGTIRCGGGGDSEEFTPVELFLTAMAGCTGSDVDWMTSRLAEPEVYELVAEGEKTKDDDGNHLDDILITFRVRFPQGEDGDRARDRLPSAMERSHDRLCTVTRTVIRGTPVEVALEEA